jgi:large subunit ribosomal protein L32
MAQKRRHSRTRTATRRAKFRGSRHTTLVTCPQCKTRIVPHRVCPTCGFYAGREVIAVEAAKAKKKEA